jgi:NADPH-dependent ferric siderophore reductase
VTATAATVAETFHPAATSGRTYTIRDWDSSRRLMTIDVLLHGVGPGTDWARRAVPGSVVMLDHPGSWHSPRAATDSQLLIADLAGLPAMARLIDALPADADAVAIVEILADTDLDYLPQRQDIEVVSSIGTGNGVAASDLGRLVKTRIRTDGRGYCWFGGEAGVAREIRKFVRRELCWKTNQFDIMGYWRLNSEDWDSRYAAVGPRLFAAYQAALADGMDEKSAAEQYDIALEQAGL